MCHPDGLMPRPRQHCTAGGAALSRAQFYDESARKRAIVRIVRFCLLPALALALAGCAAGGVTTTLLETQAAPEDLSQPDYRRIVAENIGTIFPQTATLGALAISPVRPVDHLKGPAWLTCLRILADSTPQEYALFIQGSSIIDQRAGVVMDGCKKQAYEPFDPALFLPQKNTSAVQPKKPRR